MGSSEVDFDVFSETGESKNIRMGVRFKITFEILAVHMLQATVSAKVFRVCGLR